MYLSKFEQVDAASIYWRIDKNI